ncbi:unnamed protein product [Phyllotreta striolata]|uniref:Gamma-glutamyltranspeptidase 1 n=1 Tax=Phyllotreta striolata TaxID=444603 RepID=A0A9N9TUT2_PHYSR|nr:unnamed protein product [Phyllotreta striolata]
MVLSVTKHAKITPKKIKYAIAAAALIVIIAVAVTLVIIFRPKDDKKIFKGAVVTNGPECSPIARDIMTKGGTVADAAVAALFCEGLAQPYAMGLGGGFLLTMYNRTTGVVQILNSREIAPKAATKDMFKGNPDASRVGGLAVAVPAELKGYWELYKKHGGGVSWRELVQPSVDLCKTGLTVTPHLEATFKRRKPIILGDPILSEMFVNPQTNDVYVAGDKYTMRRLCKTLEIIADEGGDALHNGSLTEGLVDDIKKRNGIITVDDLHSYRPKWQAPLSIKLSSEHTVYTPPPPGSGAVVAFILNILDGFLDLNDPEAFDNYQKIVESLKFSYAKRSLLGDPEFVNITELLSSMLSKKYAESIRSQISLNSTQTNASYYGADTNLPDDHGTANICILAPNGDAITVTSTTNYYFGAAFVSESTGIIMNDQMDDFSSENIINVYDYAPSPSNFIDPGKQPMSSMSPSIIVNKEGDVEMLVGAAGGSKIITGIAQVVIRHLWYKTDLQRAMDYKRLHHQLWPMRIDMEPEFQTEDVYIAEGLREIGHNVTFVDGLGFAAATSITRRQGESVFGTFDRRRSGSVSYL